MKKGLFLLLSLVFGFGSAVMAQDAAPGPAPTAVYDVADVAVDVTAASAAKARDEAIAEAQRKAFTELLGRLGAPASAANKLSNDDIATLVQNFEVRDEKASAVRYIGTFAVQFRPQAVRNYLGTKQAAYDDTQGQPMLILPITKDANKIIMWEEPTRWQALWTASSHDGGIVPLIVPTGAAEDKPLLTTVDAVTGKVEPIKALIQKYKANGAVVVVLNGAADNPATGYTIDYQHFGAAYDDGSDVEHITLAGNPDKAMSDVILRDGIKQIRQQIEKEWKQTKKEESTLTSAAPAGADTPVSVSSALEDDTPAPATIAVSVEFATLAQWTDIQRRLLATPGVKRVDETSVNRGHTDIELGFAGKLDDLQLALAQKGLRLTQDILSGQWMLKGF